MGRRDAVQVTLEIVARCRQLLPSLIVTYEPGWERRGNGTSPNYDYGTMHHTASASSLARPFPTQGILRDGRAGLSGPLCNSGGPACTVDAPRLHIVSANPANHAGASRASGPVPALSLFNPRTWGHEIDYAGSSPMLDGQMLVARVLTRAVADVLAGGNVEHVRAHQETSITGKWDPGYAPGRTINMADFRASARALVPGGPSTPPPPPTPQEPTMYTVSSTLGYSLVVPGLPAINYGSRENVSGTTGVPEMRTTAELHQRISDALARAYAASTAHAVPLVVNVADSAYFMLAGDRYAWLQEMDTVNGLLSAGAGLVRISQAEHENWVKEFGSEKADLTLDGKAVAELPAPVIDTKAIAVATADEIDQRDRARLASA